MAFQDQHYIYDGSQTSDDTGLSIGAYESAWLADLVGSYVLEQVEATTAVDMQLLTDDLPPDEALPDQEDATAMAEIWAAVRKLPDQQRDAILLVYAEEMTHAQAGEIMGCKETTVSWHIHEARKTLRGLL